MAQSKPRNIEAIEEIHAYKRDYEKRIRKPETQFGKYTPGTPFGIRKNREKAIKKI